MRVRVSVIWAESRGITEQAKGLLGADARSAAQPCA